MFAIRKYFEKTVPWVFLSELMKDNRVWELQFWEFLGCICWIAFNNFHSRPVHGRAKLVLYNTYNPNKKLL